MHARAFAIVSLTSTLLASATWLAGSARAADGVIEINHARALVGDVTPGDAPGYPVTITQSGSYVLTSHMPVPDASTDGIVVTALRTSIDFAGFEIRGPNLKPAANTACSAPGSGVGVRSGQNVAVRDGRVSGMGSHGLDLGPGSRVESMSVTQNCGDGIRVAFTSVVTDSQATLNNLDGISAGSASRVRDSIGDANGAMGIAASTNSVVSGCIATVNVSRGISVGSGSVVTSSLANGNGGAGIFATEASSIVDNVSNGNAIGYDGAVDTNYSSLGGNTLRNNVNSADGFIAIGCNSIGASLYCPPPQP